MLTYGMGMTCIFREFGIPPKDEAFMKLLHTNIYDNWSLHRIGYRKIGGRWVHRVSGQEVDLDFNREILVAEAGPSEPHTDTANQSLEVATPAPIALDTDMAP